jgi:hypothetical protein
MPRDECSIFAFGVPTYRDAKEAFFGTTPALKIENTDNVKQPPKQEEKKQKPHKKMESVVRKYIQALLVD